MKKPRFGKKGLTLIELLIGMAIMIMVMAIVGLVMQSAYYSLSNSQILSEINSDERNSSRLIINQVRFATNGDFDTDTKSYEYDFELTDAVPGSFVSGYDYVYFGEQSGEKGLFIRSGGTTNFSKLDSVGNVEFKISGSSAPYSLVYEVYDSSGTLMFSDSVQLLNIVDYDYNSGLDNICVRYMRL